MPLARFAYIFVVAFAFHAVAEPTPPTGAKDPLQLVKDAAAFAKNTQDLSFAMEISTHLEIGGEVRDITLKADVALSGDRKSVFKISTPTESAEVSSNGTDQFIYREADKKFMKVKAPLDREDALSMISGDPMRMSTIWLGQVLNNSLDLLQGATGEYLGSENGQDHVKLVYPTFTLELWLAQGAAPTPQRMVMDVTPALSRAPEGAKAVNTVVFSNWQTAPAFAAEHFAWKAPEGATEDKPRTGAPGAELLGKAAPDFSLKMLDGSDMKLSNHKDKDVVILDFFATWCGPCRMSMPIIDKVADDYKSKGVAFYAVNCGEDGAKVKSYLEGQKLEVPVAMDAAQEVQAKYGANSIPRMIVVGKDGTVQAIHAGFSPALDRELREQLDTLLSGKKLEE